MDIGMLMRVHDQFAGLYDTWKSENGEEMYSCTILTTAIAPELKWLHTRMPVQMIVGYDVLPGGALTDPLLLGLSTDQVILDDDGVTRWLSDAKFESLRDLLISYRGVDLKFHPVDKRRGLSVSRHRLLLVQRSQLSCVCSWLDKVPERELRQEG